MNFSEEDKKKINDGLMYGLGFCFSLGIMYLFGLIGILASITIFTAINWLNKKRN